METDSRYLLLGARGAGMVAIAEILRDIGHTVFGLDSTVTGQDTSHAGCVIREWTTDNVRSDFDICVASPAVPTDDPVYLKVKERGCPLLTLPECLSEVFAQCRQLCVAGTHGKSTTSAMLATILSHSHTSHGFFVGARVPDFQRSGKGCREGWAVIESCEFQRSFHQLTPHAAIVTGMERDHFDCFPTQELEDAAFARFLNQTSENGFVLADADCDRSMQVAERAACEVITFSIESSNADWTASRWSRVRGITTFECSGPDHRFTASISVPGRHNIKNALAAIGAAASIGICPIEAASGLSDFRGIERRFEYRGTYGGVTLIDDYAHHPTAIRETIRTARECFPGHRILVAFEPHQMIRTETLYSDFVSSLSEADEAWLLPVFAARENATHLERCRLSGQLVKELNRCGTRSFLFANLDQIVSRVDHSGKPRDILLTMGAGRTNLIHDELNRRLQRHSVA